MLSKDLYSNQNAALKSYIRRKLLFESKMHHRSLAFREDFCVDQNATFKVSHLKDICEDQNAWKSCIERDFCAD